jgi:hypothetical protein
MGSWRTHISYTNISQITQSNEKIYGISAGSLFSVNKNDNIIETYSKIYGLNDNDIHLIKYSKYNDFLFIAYKNSNIDLVTEDGSIVNISDIYRKSLSGSKIINDVCFNDEFAYIACDFGISILNLNKKEFAETYSIGTDGFSEKIINISLLNSNIYALTSSNILVGNTSKNLINYQNWTTLSNPDTKNSNVKMILTNDTIYLLKSNSISLSLRVKILLNFPITNILSSKKNIEFTSINSML